MSAPTLYLQTVPVMIKYLRNLSGIVAKGEKFCDEKGIPHEEMLNYRLVEDMRGLPYQVQSCSNTAKFTIQRLGSTEVPYFEDNESTFAELQTRITKTIELLEKTDPQSMAGLEGKEVLMETKSMGSFRFKSGQEYASNYALANFHFHLTSAYCILRTKGVPVGALDYMNDVFVKMDGSSMNAS